MAIECIVAGPAPQRVVTVATPQRVPASVSRDDIVTGPAVDLVAVVTAREGVGPSSAAYAVVAGSTDKRVGTGSADEGVATVAAVKGAVAYATVQGVFTGTAIDKVRVNSAPKPLWSPYTSKVPASLRIAVLQVPALPHDANHQRADAASDLPRVPLQMLVGLQPLHCEEARGGGNVERRDPEDDRGGKGFVCF